MHLVVETTHANFTTPKILNVWERFIGYMKLKVMSQTLNTQSSSLNVVRLTYLSSADAALSPVAVSDIEISW